MSPTRSKAQMADLASLGLSIDGGSAKVREVIGETSLQLPAKGQYWARLNRQELHIYEETTGIRGFTVGDPSEQDSIQVGGNEIVINLNRGAVRRIILHQTPEAAPSTALPLDDLEAPVGLIKELGELLAKKRLSADELERKRALLKEIGDDFRRAEEQRAPKSAPARSPRPSASYSPPSYSSGESCRGTSYSG